MGKPDGIPAPVVRRLSLYLRRLEESQARNRTTISSHDLSVTLGLTGSQVRKDLAHFGQFGQPGIGYRVDDLITQMRQILGADRLRKVILVGAGNLGRALMSYRGFLKKNFQLVAVFDNDPRLVGRPTPQLVYDAIQPLEAMPQVVKTHQVSLGIITVPAAAAQATADLMISAGVGGLLNFAPVILQTRPHVIISTVDLAVQLEQLSFQVNLTARRDASSDAPPEG